MKIQGEILDQLDQTKCYCYTCILENSIVPLNYNKANTDSFIEIKCKHTGRNMNTLRFHKGSWHLFYGFLKEAKCRTCQAQANL